MDRLKATIAACERWSVLLEYVARIEAYRDSNFPLCIENAKALIESVAKEICKQKGMDVSNDDAPGKLLKMAFACLGYGDDEPIQQIGRALSNIGFQVGHLRNEIGVISHGKTLEELTKSKEVIDRASSDFLLFSTELVCCFLIQLVESETKKQAEDSAIIEYEENPEFNDFWDDQYPEFLMGEYSFAASEILYKLDPLAYRTEFAAFTLSSDETDNGK
jgi:hypothetical protein